MNNEHENCRVSLMMDATIRILMVCGREGYMAGRCNDTIQYKGESAHVWRYYV